MKKALLPFLLVCLLGGCSLELPAQKKDFYRGWVVLPEGDTLYGRVKDRSSGPYGELLKKIRFLPDGKRSRHSYGPNQLQAYAVGNQIFECIPLYEDSEFFRFDYCIDYKRDAVFLKLIAREGPLSWYHWETMDAESSYIDYVPLFHKEGSMQMVRVTQGILGLKKNRLTDYFPACPELKEALENKSLRESGEVFDFLLDHCY